MPDDNEIGEISSISDSDEACGSGSDVESPGKVAADVKIPFWLKVFLFVGLVCTGQFFVCSLIGVFRGYSVQSWWPIWIMLGGVFALLVPQCGMPFMCRGKSAKYLWISFLVSFCIIFFSIAGMSQGKYREQGDALFKQGEYSVAIGIYQKEIDTWYLRLRYNYHEDACLFQVAECYCQMEDFDQARQMYRFVTERYKGYYKERSAAEAAELDVELGNIVAFQEQLAGEVEDENKANILFDIALAYRSIGCIKKAKEQYEIIQTLDVREGIIKNAKKFSAGLDST